MTFNQISTISEEHRVMTPLALDDPYRASADIEVFLRDKFKQIRNDHPLKGYISPSWPSDTVVQQLVAKSSGQFIYVSTVVKYVQSNRHSPMERLEVVLGIRSRYDSSLPFAELDALYTQMLSSVKEEDIGLVHDILALMMIPQASTNVTDMETFLSLSPGRILLLFGNLISCPPDYLKSRDDSYCHINDRPREYLGLSFLHASLPDFLRDEARSKHLSINPTLRYTRMLDYCFHHLRIDPFAPVRCVERHIDHFCSMAAPTADLHQKIWNFSFLQRRDNALHHVVYSVNLMQNFLSGIKKSKFDDADQMYNHHLKQFDELWMSILRRFSTKENFDFLLIFAQYGLHWRVSLNSVREGMQPEALVREYYKTLRPIPSLSTRAGFTIDVNSPFRQLLEDPSRSAIDGAKYATTALTYFKCMAKYCHMYRDRITIHLCFILDLSAKSDELVDWALRFHTRARCLRLPAAHHSVRRKLGEATVYYLGRHNALPPS